MFDDTRVAVAVTLHYFRRVCVCVTTRSPGPDPLRVVGPRVARSVDKLRRELETNAIGCEIVIENINL